MSHRKKPFMDKHFRNIDGVPHISTLWAARVSNTSKTTISNYMPGLIVKDVSGKGWVPLDDFLQVTRNKFEGWRLWSQELHAGGRGKERKCFLTGRNFTVIGLPVTKKNRENCLEVMVRFCPYYTKCENLIPVTDVIEKILREGEGETAKVRTE